MDILVQRLGMVGNPVVGIFVYPVGHRHIFHPPVFRSAMVENHIHDQFYSLFPCLGSKFTVLFIGSVTGINFVKVSSGVTVIGSGRLVIFQQGIEPDRCKTHPGDVIQMIFKSLDISSMSSHWISPVGFLLHPCYFIIPRIAIGKTVRHDQVQYVAVVKALAHG